MRPQKREEHTQFISLISQLTIALSQTAKRIAPHKHKVQGKNKRTTPTKSKTRVIWYISEAFETKIVPYFIKMQICMRAYGMHTPTPPPTMHPPKCTPTPPPTMHPPKCTPTPPPTMHPPKCTPTPPPTMHPPKCTPTRTLCQTHPTAGCQHPPGKQRSPPAGRACLQSCSGTPPPNRLREPDTGPPLRDFLSATPVKLLSCCHFFLQALVHGSKCISSKLPLPETLKLLLGVGGGDAKHWTDVRGCCCCHFISWCVLVCVCVCVCVCVFVCVCTCVRT